MTHAYTKQEHTHIITIILHLPTYHNHTSNTYTTILNTHSTQQRIANHIMHCEITKYIFHIFYNIHIYMKKASHSIVISHNQSHNQTQQHKTHSHQNHNTPVKFSCEQCNSKKQHTIMFLHEHTITHITSQKPHNTTSHEHYPEHNIAQPYE